MDLVYLIGPPGVGKSTLMAELTKNCGRYEVPGHPAYDALLKDGKVIGVELGKRREAFSGTDALPMDVHPKALRWIAEAPFPLVLGEGMRLGTVGFFGAARDAGYKVHVINVHAAEKVAQERREARGSKQSAKWVLGATTRAKNLRSKATMGGFSVHTVATYDPPEQVADNVRFLVPTLEVLK